MYGHSIHGCSDFVKKDNPAYLEEVYKCARKEGQYEVLVSKLKGQAKHPKTLETVLEDYETYSDSSLFYEGFVVPERIKGTYDSSRSYCFSKSFRPLPDTKHGDFSAKWQIVYRDVPKWLNSGNRIELIEFMHDLYIVEGNKRVSVAKYKKIPEVGVSIKRLIPKLSNNRKDVDDYHRYMDFEKRTGLRWIYFSDADDFDKIENVIDFIYGDKRTKYSDFMTQIYIPFLHSYLRICHHQPRTEIGDVFMSFLDQVEDPKNVNSNTREKIIKKTLKKSQKII